MLSQQKQLHCIENEECEQSQKMTSLQVETIVRAMTFSSLKRTALSILLSSALICSESQAQNGDHEVRQRLAGIAAYAACKVRHSGYNNQRAELIVNTAIKKNNWEAEADWIQSNQAKQAIDLISQAMNQDCSDFDQSSKYFNSAMQAIDSL